MTFNSKFKHMSDTIVFQVSGEGLDGLSKAVALRMGDSPGALAWAVDANGLRFDTHMGAGANMFPARLGPDEVSGIAWDLSQREALVESIFQRIDIGKFTFNERPPRDERPKFYEVIDGKQRLMALCAYYEDRFRWRGRLFSELSQRDSWHFKNYQVAVGFASGATDEQVMRMFVRLNTTGTPMDQDHLERVQAMIGGANG